VGCIQINPFTSPIKFAASPEKIGKEMRLHAKNLRMTELQTRPPAVVNYVLWAAAGALGLQQHTTCPLHAHWVR